MKTTELNIIDETSYIEVIGAKEHNLKNVDVKIPRDKLIVFTGVSGSGKSSLAFDTIYAEGQRRYIETLSAYARQFLGELERPNVDKISGLSPVVSIEQKTISKNPRSTVGTITELYDFLRLLFANTATAYSKVSGEKMVKYTEEQIINLLLNVYKQKRITLLAPVVKGRKGHYKELFEQYKKLGFLKARVDGELIDLEGEIRLDRFKTHDVEIVIDRMMLSESAKLRLSKSIATAFKHGKGTILIWDNDAEEIRHFSKSLMCPTSGISYEDPAPNLFSFNSPYGSCSSCNGIGTIAEIEFDKIIPDIKKSIKSGGIPALSELKDRWILSVVEGILIKYDYSSSTSLEKIEKEVLNKILYGTEEDISYEPVKGLKQKISQFEGLVNYIKRLAEDSSSKPIKRWATSFTNETICPSCNGSRITENARYFKIGNENISDVANLNLSRLKTWIEEVPKHLSNNEMLIGKEVLAELSTRLDFLLNVGLHYLSLNRSSKTLSGGEAQRIRLATQIGSQLIGVLYILDEPSIGLHQRDNEKLINSLKNLRDIGNTVLVVEHDKDMMLASDFIVDIGPKAGKFGGQVMAQLPPAELMKENSDTAKYLKDEINVAELARNRKGSGEKLVLKGAKGNNLKNVTLEIPLGKFTCITGVSGSGKSSLINHTLYPILNAHYYNGVKKPLEYKSITGLDLLDKVIEIDQSPIGRTPRSNPATYTGVFTEIRNLFSIIPEAKIRGYKAGRFSFNVSGGRCETCKGAGVKTVEMNFLPDVYVECDICDGKRYNRETLEVRYKGKSISDILFLTINEGVDFFENIPKIHQKLKALKDVGLGYITLGQSSTTLSGGEAQRVKLASELSKRQTGKTIYILDEPSTGLHFEDIKVLMGILHKLADLGNTIVVIEHNTDIIKQADYIVDIGPEGGENGGEIVVKGSVKDLLKKKKGITWKYLS